MPTVLQANIPRLQGVDFSRVNARILALLPETERQRLLDSFTPDEARLLEYTWEFWARPNQMPPPGNWTVWGAIAGRGFGKTRLGAEWIRAIAEQGEIERIGLIGQTVADVRDVIVEGDSGILSISPPWFRPKYEPSKRQLTWPNGVIGKTYSGDEPDQLRGPQHGAVWADEPAKWKYLQETWDNMEMGLRMGKRPRITFTTTPRPIPFIKKMIDDGKNTKGTGVVITAGTTDENLANLPEAFIRRIYNKYKGTRIGDQELGGKLLENIQGVLWQPELIEKYRCKKVEIPPLSRIVVAVDPQASEPDEDDDQQNIYEFKGGAETGIVIGGLGIDGHGYILGDVTVDGSPKTWGNAAIDAYNTWEADRIVAEVNNGGAMVKYVIESISSRVSFKEVRASRGKVIRAEPVVALYEQGKVHHVGLLADLEFQMTNWLPGQTSPDRLDALVWLVTELMLGAGKREADVF